MDGPLAINIAVFAGLLFSLVVHECAHGIVASWLGDNTARDLGRITLNPVPHIDPFWSILLPLMLFLSNRPMFGGAKPVPVNMMNLRNPIRDMMWVALAGPVSNFLLAIGFALLLNLTPLLAEWELTVAENFLRVFYGIVLVNLMLALFNLIPIPPLDGGRILAAFLPPRAAAYMYDYQVQSMGMLLVALLVFTGGTRILVPILSAAAKWLFHFTVFVG